MQRHNATAAAAESLILFGKVDSEGNSAFALIFERAAVEGSKESFSPVVLQFFFSLLLLVLL